MRIASEKIGRGSEAFAVHAGGQELPMHDSRLDPSYAVAYKCEPTPGRHTVTSYQDIDLRSGKNTVSGSSADPKISDLVQRAKI